MRTRRPLLESQAIANMPTTKATSKQQTQSSTKPLSRCKTKGPQHPLATTTEPASACLGLGLAVGLAVGARHKLHLAFKLGKEGFTTTVGLAKSISKFRVHRFKHVDLLLQSFDSSCVSF